MMTQQEKLQFDISAKHAAMLAEPLLARLATASLPEGQPHVVPVWYLWDGDSLWISAYRSTRKVRMLMQNPRCAVVVDRAGNNGEAGILFEGQAELVTGPFDFLVQRTAEIYTRYLGEDGVLAPDPQEWMHSPENLLIHLTPEKVYTW